MKVIVPKKRHLIILLLSISFLAQSQDYLPPAIHWSGKSEELIRAKNDIFISPAEASNFENTATLKETIEYFERLTKTSQLVSLSTIGETKGGFPLYLVKVSSEKAFHNNSISTKPTLLVQAGIHAGEIDGKDACMMLVRDLVENKTKLLANVNLLIIPVLNMEGHERVSPYNRINQRGPSNMGWRTNGQNLNLNRDYMKVDTREIETVLKVIDTYKPSLYLDIHVTDGADYQYDITYGFIGNHGYSPAISDWLKSVYRKNIDNGLEKMGHIPGSLLFAKNNENFVDGNLDYTFNPDFSHAYGDAIHLPTVLVENHSLKPFRQRVLGTYVLIEESLKLLAKENNSLQIAINKDLQKKPINTKMNWVFDQSSNGSNTNPWNADNSNATPTETVEHKGVSFEKIKSLVTGNEYVRWTGQKTSSQINVFQNTTAKDAVLLPDFYVIPSYQQELIETLKKHHIPFEYMALDSTFNAEVYFCINPNFAKTPFEGRIKVNSEVNSKMMIVHVPAKSVLIDKNKAKFTLASLLLEPKSPSSLFQWGFTNTIFSRTEYIESYVMEPYMNSILAQNTEVKAAFEEKKKDEKFANNPRAIYEWFYTESPFVDQEYQKYPVYRIFNSIKN